MEQHTQQGHVIQGGPALLFAVYEMSEKHKLESGFMFIFLNLKVMKCKPLTASSNPARDESCMSHQGKRTEFWDRFIKILRVLWELLKTHHKRNI
jgi:hypothetical protein